MSNPGILLLDKDGTLIDIHHYWGSMIQLRSALVGDLWFGHLGKEELQKIELSLTDRMGFGPDQRLKPDGPVGVQPREAIAEIVAAAVRGLGRDVSAEEVDSSIFARVDHETAENLAPLLRLLPGVSEFLRECRGRGLELAVVTTDLTARAEEALETLGIRSLFDHVAGGDSVDRTKPAPDLVANALEARGMLAENAVVIGDHPVDIQMGLNAGVACNIAVLTGLSGASRFEGCDCWVADDFRNFEIGETC